MATSPIPRIPAAERRSRTIASATEVFAAHGYHGTTTDQIARAAGISQPYVVRMFGGKEALFLEVMRESLDRILEVFREVLARSDAGAAADSLGAAYVELARTERVHVILLQAFAASGDPVVGPRARAGFVEILDVLTTEAGLSMNDASDFLARGMLINTLMVLGVDDDASPELGRLFQHVLGDGS
jgi:TetR/AcrR family transcriptional regulator